MSRFVHVHVTDSRWVRVDGRYRCTLCGDLVEVAWVWFDTPSTWTRALCEPCVESTLKEEA